MSESEKMLRQKIHSLFVVGKYRVDPFKMPGLRVDADQRKRVLFPPQTFQSAVGENGKRSADVLLLQKIQ